MLEKSSNPMTIKQIFGRYKEGNLLFDHPVQRREGQWTNSQKSLLIHSVIDDFMIPTTVVVKGDGVSGKGNSYSVIDGQQRLTTILHFLNGDFKLDESTPLFKKIPLEIDAFVEETPETEGRPVVFPFERLVSEDDVFIAFDASGLGIDDLPEELYDEFITKSLPVTMYDSCITEEEIEEVFFRLNNGTPLSSTQKTKAKLGSELLVKITNLIEHPFVKEVVSFTKAQYKNEKDLELCLTLIYLSEYHFNNIELPNTLSSSFVSKYGAELKEKEQQYVDDLFNKTSNAMDFLYSSLADFTNDKDIKDFMKKNVHILPVYLTALFSIDNQMDEGKFGSFIEQFATEFQKKSTVDNVNNYISVYRESTGAGAGKKALFNQRFETMREAILYDMKDLLNNI